MPAQISMPKLSFRGAATCTPPPPKDALVIATPLAGDRPDQDKPAEAEHGQGAGLGKQG